MSYYNNYPAYDPAQQQYQLYQQQQSGLDRNSTSNAMQQQQYANSSNNSDGSASVMPPMGVPPPQQQRLPSDVQAQYQYAAAAAWNYHQQQNIMRYPVQPPPTYPPPAYAYPQQYQAYPPHPQPTPRGYYAYPQQPSPSSVSAYSSGPRQGVSPLYPQAAIPPAPLPAAPASAPERRAEEAPPMDVKQALASPVTEAKEVKKQPIVVGKRRGGRVLPTGVVKKQKTESTEQGRKDPWSQYMHEVKRYKDQSCEDDNRKNRPLVK